MKIKNKKASLIYKIVLCIIGIISIIMTTGILDGNFNPKVFTMFTTLSNIFCILYFIMDTIHLSINYHSRNTTNIFPAYKYASTIAVVLTFIVALLVLKMGFNFDSFINASFLGVHFIIPLMALGDWILFDKKGYIKKKDPILWLIFPSLYFIIAEVYALIGDGFGVTEGSKYPYFFMDVEKLGFLKVLSTSLLMGVGCLVIGYIFYFIDHIQKKR